MSTGANLLPPWASANANVTDGIITSFDEPIMIVLLALIAGALSLLMAVKFAMDINSMEIPKELTETTKLAQQIAQGSDAFLQSEYTLLSCFVMVVFVLIWIFLDSPNGICPVTGICFLVGAFLSASCGYVGMQIATRANIRTCVACAQDENGVKDTSEALNRGLKVAFKSGSVMALSVVSCGLLGVCICYLIVATSNGPLEEAKTWSQLAGFAFGASSIALFARVGGGIYTKAADVGADLVGKVEEDLAEDSPDNPATIADNVGDNVGDVAGMGADLFESFVGSIIAACTLGDLAYGPAGVALPLWVAGMGAIISLLGTFLVKAKPKAEMDAITDAIKHDIEIKQQALRREARLLELLHAIRFAIYLTSFVVILGTILIVLLVFGNNRTGWYLFITICIGNITGNLIGYFTEYATSYTEWPTQSISEKTATGPATVIIQGLGIGMLSTVPPVFFLSAAILASYYLSGVYGIAISAVGMLSTLGITLATDAYGPVADNAGGIAEMAPDSEIASAVRDETDSLDALGNTTAATGKGFAIGSAVLTALALMNAFAESLNITIVNLLDPVVLPGILIGALLPFVFAALTMLSVGAAAEDIMYECRRQLNDRWSAESAGKTYVLDSQKCVIISTKASLREMVAPGLIAISAPLVVGCFLGGNGLMGLLAGGISSGFMLGVTMANAGGAWDNAKKHTESNGLKKTDRHKAAVVGDTVGDPFKDTSGPALNILIKLMSVISLVFAPLFKDSTGALRAPWDLWVAGLIILLVVIIVLYFFQKMVVANPNAAAERKKIDDKATERHAANSNAVKVDEKVAELDVSEEVVSESAPLLQAEPVAEPAAEPQKVAEPAVAEPEPAVAEPEPAVAEPEPAVAEPELAVAEPEPAAAEPQAAE